jgi:hypothetical protein
MRVLMYAVGGAAAHCILCACGRPQFQSFFAVSKLSASVLQTCIATESVCVCVSISAPPVALRCGSSGVCLWGWGCVHRCWLLLTWAPQPTSLPRTKGLCGSARRAAHAGVRLRVCTTPPRAPATAAVTSPTVPAANTQRSPICALSERVLFHERLREACLVQEHRVGGLRGGPFYFSKSRSTCVCVALSFVSCSSTSDYECEGGLHSTGCAPLN